MTREEALAAIKPFLPTNPTHPATHVSVPLEALKVLIEATVALDAILEASKEKSP